MRIEDLTPTNMGDLAGFCGGIEWVNEGPAGACEEADLGRMEQGARLKATFLRERMKLGARGKIAYHGSIPVGFVEYYPIESAPVDIEGQDITALWCTKVKPDYRRRGIGTGLMERCFAEVHRLGRKGVACICNEPFWMEPKAFFLALGMVEVDSRDRVSLMFREFEPVSAPRLMERRFSGSRNGEEAALDIVWNSRCPGHWRNAQLARAVANEFGYSVAIKEHNTDARRKLLELGLGFGLFLNGEQIFGGGPISASELRAKVKDVLSGAKG
jgi:GNAT superfamily N-acetyltransferase